MAADDTPTALQREVELVPTTAPTVAEHKASEAALGGAAKVTAAGAAMLGTLGSKMNAAMSKYSDLPGASKRGTVAAPTAVAPSAAAKVVVVDVGPKAPGGARLDRIFAALDTQAKAVPVQARVAILMWVRHTIAVITGRGVWQFPAEAGGPQGQVRGRLAYALVIVPCTLVCTAARQR